MPAIWPIVCDTAMDTWSGADWTAVTGYSLTAPARAMDLLGHSAFGETLNELRLHNTSWPSPDPGIHTTAQEDAAYDRLIWYSPSWIKPSSVFSATGYGSGTEDGNLILYMLDKAKTVGSKAALVGLPMLGPDYSQFNLPQPGRYRSLYSTETPAAANTFEDMAVVWDNSYLSSDCDYYIISACGHSSTASAFRFIRLTSPYWGNEYAPVFPGRSDPNAYHCNENRYALFYCHPGTETLTPQVYNASTEATKVYCVVWEHKLSGR